MKKKQEVLVGSQKKWTCPFCACRVNRLTVAHKGTRVKEIILDVMKKNPRKGFLFLDDKVRDAHETVHLSICCDKCNKKMED